MKAYPLIITAGLLTACSAFGASPEFSATGVGSVEAGVACVTDEVTDDGWTVVGSSEAGLVRAERGSDWVEARILPVRELNPAYVIEVNTAGTDAARNLGGELAAECGD